MLHIKTRGGLRNTVLKTSWAHVHAFQKRGAGTF